MNEQLIVDIILLVVVLAMAIATIEVRSLFASGILAGIYSLMMALVWATLHAMDVAFTEAAVGAGISTVLILGALTHVGRIEKRPAKRVDLRGVALVLITGGFLVYGTLDMPAFGDPKAPVHTLRVPEMLAQQVGKSSLTHDEGVDVTASATDLADDFDGHVPNTVTSVLATYRGYDTMFETHVILIAGIAMLLLLRREPRLNGGAK